LSLVLSPNGRGFGRFDAAWRDLPEYKTRFGLVEAAGVEPASEAASPRISTSVSEILVLAWRLLSTGSASASRGDCPTSGPWRPCGSDPVYVTPFLGPPD